MSAAPAHNLDLRAPEVVKTIGQVFGLTVRSRSIGGNIAAVLKSLAGGEIRSYVKLNEDSRRQDAEPGALAQVGPGQVHREARGQHPRQAPLPPDRRHQPQGPRGALARWVGIRTSGLNVMPGLT